MQLLARMYQESGMQNSLHYIVRIKKPHIVSRAMACITHFCYRCRQGSKGPLISVEAALPKRSSETVPRLI